MLISELPGEQRTGCSTMSDRVTQREILRLEDSAATSISNYTGAGTYRPQHSLQSMLGRSYGGTWTLTVTDDTFRSLVESGSSTGPFELLESGYHGFRRTIDVAVGTRVYNELILGNSHVKSKHGDWFSFVLYDGANGCSAGEPFPVVDGRR
jgi:hypothetical protein